MGMSSSSRRAWIEIELKKLLVQLTQVALLAEGVDRNTLRKSASSTVPSVALLAEGVDRNRRGYA